MRRGGRPLKVNLYRDGYETAAEHIGCQIGTRRGSFVVTILPDGGVRSVPRYDYSASEYDDLVTRPMYLATYNGEARINQIEDDLIEWLRESTQAIAA